MKTTFIAGICLDPALALRVEGRGGLVQQEDGRVTDQGPGYGYPLLLASCNAEIMRDSHRYEHYKILIYKLKYMLMKQDCVAFCRAINKENPLTETIVSSSMQNREQIMFVGAIKKRFEIGKSSEISCT